MAAHSLYVQAADADNEATLGVLQFIVRHISVIRQMGVKLRAHKISAADLQDDRLVAALQKRGVTRLPALVTPNQAYQGAQTIIELYQRNIKEFSAQRTPNPRARPTAPTDLDSFFHQEMHGSDGNVDLQDDDGMGEGSNMMDTYRQMVARREGGVAGPPRPHAPRRNPDEAPRAPPKMGGRPDNVRDDGDDIQDTVDQLARNVRGPPARGPPARGPPPPPPPPTRGPPPTQGPPPQFDDEEEHNPQDDIMERAYLANMEDSIGGEDD